jgi:hypothetical protein
MAEDLTRAIQDWLGLEIDLNNEQIEVVSGEFLYVLL